MTRHIPVVWTSEREETRAVQRIFLPFQADEHYGVAEVGELEETRPDVNLVDENTLWEEGHAAGAIGSRGKPKDRAFIRENYRLLHRCRTLIQEKRVCIYVCNDTTLRVLCRHREQLGRWKEQKLK